MSSANGNGPSSPGKDRAPPLPKRFYKSAIAASDPHGGGHRVLLDGKSIRTPAKRELLLPALVLAEAIAAEWAAQGERIDPAGMPLTRLANSAIDGVAGRMADVRAEIVKYAGSDLLCYRADSPPDLVQRQRQAWDPLLAWASEAFGAPFAIAAGVMPVAQPEPCRAAVGAALEPYDAFRLSSLHVMTTLMGSALLALAHVHGRLTVEQAWATAHVDEDWQIERWGEDAEAKARRQRRWSEMQAASRLLALLH